MKSLKLTTIVLLGSLSVLTAQTPILRSTSATVTTTGAAASIITENGGVLGIGTTAPAEYLHIKRQGTISSFGGPPAITTTAIRMEYGHVIGGGNTQYAISVSEGEFYIGTTSSNPRQFKLKSNNIVEVRCSLKIYGLTSGNVNSVYSTTAANQKEIGWMNQTTGTGAETTTPLTFRYDASSGTDRTIMTMHPSGQIRIGDANNTYANYVDGSSTFNEQMRVLVEGGVVAQHYVNTTQNWADFVFDSCAVNPTLEDEKVSIKTHKTLVGVPSENDVKNGVDMANTDMILLMKIEQNYLNDLSQEDRLNLLLLEMESLKKQNEVLQQQVKDLMLKLEGK